MADLEDPIADVLAPLRPGYVKRLAEKTQRLRAYHDAFAEGRADLAMLRELRALVHDLHGSGSTFGYPEVSAAAARVEDLAGEALKGSTLEASAGKKLTERVGVLQGACEAVVAGSSGSA